MFEKVKHPNWDENIKTTTRDRTSASFSNELLCSMPRELTAENGAKGLLSGEFKEEVIIDCSNCDGDGYVNGNADDICDECDGAGDFSVSVPVQWTTIKEIYATAVKHLGT